MWSRWKAGQSLHEIGRALGKPHSRSRLLLARRRDRSARSSPFAASAHPGRTRRHLPRNRQRLRRCGSSPNDLHRAASTVSREVARHGGRAQYRANEADQQAWESALRPKPCLLATAQQAAQRSLRVN